MRSALVVSIQVILFFLCTVSSAQSLDFSATGYDMHIELNWSSFATADRYEVWRKDAGESEFNLIRSTRLNRIQDWTGRAEMQSTSYSYYIQALSVPGNILQTSDTLDAIVREMTDDEFLDMTQAYTFRYFWEYAHPVSGMARERLGSEDIVATGGTGFGIM